MMRDITSRNFYRTLLAADNNTKMKAALIMLAGLACLTVMLLVS